VYCDNIQSLIEQLENQIENNKRLQKDIMDGYLKSCSESVAKKGTDDESDRRKSKKTVRNEHDTDDGLSGNEISDDEISEESVEQPKKLVVKKKSKIDSRPGTKKRSTKAKARRATVRKRV